VRTVLAFLAAVLAASAGAAAKPQVGLALPNLASDYGAPPNACFSSCVDKTFFSAGAMQYFQGLGVTYVRTGWIPGFFVRADRFWRFTDPEMATICESGLKVAIIVPGFEDTPKPPRPGAPWTTADLQKHVRAFFARYTRRFPGCFLYAELDNEADLAKNGYASVEQYAAYYEAIAPIPKSFGIPVVTAGTSGEDPQWLGQLALQLQAAGAPVDAYGYHPYGVVADTGSVRGAVTQSIERMARAANVDPSHIYVTELGMKSGPQLQWAMIQAAALSPYVTVFTYFVFPPDGGDATYALAAHAGLLQGFKDGVAAIAAGEEPPP
jgi:hypothetical protein